jgi:hypothetical protein
VGMEYDKDVLRLYPDATGMQHDETRRLPFKLLAKIDRTVPVDAPLHETVIQRFETKDVQLYDEFRPYRPEGLRSHQSTAKYYRP